MGTVDRRHNPNYPVALEFPAPLTSLDAAVQQAVAGYAAEADLRTAFRDATLSLFAQPPGEGPQGVYTVTEDDGTRHVLAARGGRAAGPPQSGASHQPDDPCRGTAADGHRLTRAAPRKRRQDLTGAEQPWAFAERSAKALNAALS